MVHTNEGGFSAARAPGGTALSTALTFDAFFRAEFRNLVRYAMYVGATQAEAQDAASKALAEMWPRWGAFRQPHAYARRAVLSNFVKEKGRGPGRVVKRMIEHGAVSLLEGTEDPQLTVWEDEEWIRQLLSLLPPAQREVMEGVLIGLAPAEIAVLLGKTSAAIRQNLLEARKRLARDPQVQEKRRTARRRSGPVANSPREAAK